VYTLQNKNKNNKSVSLTGTSEQTIALPHIDI